MAQVAGRAGRKGVQGKVIIQTRRPDAPVLEMVRHNDYIGFYKQQMEERYSFSYPPYVRLICISLKSTDLGCIETAATALASNLKELFGQQAILGPDAPPVPRVMYRHIRRIIVKAGLDVSPANIRLQINKAVTKTESQKLLGKVTLSFDADPQ